MDWVKGEIAPDYIEPIISYRGFRIPLLQGLYNEAPLTSSTYKKISWWPGEIKKAECLKDGHACDCTRRPFWDRNLRIYGGGRIGGTFDRKGPPPHKEGWCGIYSLKIDDRWEITNQVNVVAVAFAEMEIWGRVIEHFNGYRSEYARIKRILEISHAPGWVNVDDFLDAYNNAEVQEWKSVNPSRP